MTEIKWITFNLLLNCPRVVHGVFLRHGGVSDGEFSSLNFGISQGDDPAKVAINQARAQNALGIQNIARLYQCHGKSIIEASPYQIDQGDALTTDQPKLGLMILHADCQAAVLYDPILHVLAAVHCGWRGSVLNIYKETIEWMQTRYGSKPENLLACIAPSLGPNAAEFQNYKTELPESFRSFQVKPLYFDFWAISREQLENCGLLSHHIEIAEQCTFSNSQDFFSYRRVKKSGRHGTLATLL